jgi:hypothetical protein
MLVIPDLTGVGRAVPTSAQGGEPYNPISDPAHFVEGVDNPFFPLTRGTTYTYEEVSEGIAQRTEVSVMSNTREMIGVHCVVQSRGCGSRKKEPNDARSNCGS